MTTWVKALQLYQLKSLSYNSALFLAINPLKEYEFKFVITISWSALFSCNEIVTKFKILIIGILQI